MQSIKKLGFLLAVFLLFDQPHSLRHHCGLSSNRTVIAIHAQRTRIYVELALLPQDRALGLMFRTSLPQKCGMLFVFPHSAKHSFWMKNTWIPLDLAYLSDDGTLNEMFSMSPMGSEPFVHYPSTTPVRYALEVNRGWFSAHNIDIGEKITLPRPLQEWIALVFRARAQINVTSDEAGLEQVCTSCSQ